MQRAFFDIKVTHLNAPSYRQKEPSVVYRLHEKKKMPMTPKKMKREEKIICQTIRASRLNQNLKSAQSTNSGSAHMGEVEPYALMAVNAQIHIPQDADATVQKETTPTMVVQRNQENASTGTQNCAITP